MDGRGRGKSVALLLFIVWIAAVLSSSYLALDNGTDMVYIPVMGLVSMIFMIIGIMMFMSSFQNINAAMVREFLEVEIPSLARFMGLALWGSSVVFYLVFTAFTFFTGTPISAVVAFAVLIVTVLSVTVYLSRCGKFEKNRL